MRERLTRMAASPWAVGLLLGLFHYARRVVDATRFSIERFDEGIQLSSGWFVSHGELPLRDFYQPYGPGFGVPGAIGRWLFGPGIFADRLVYMLAPAAVTTVAYVWMTRRSGWRLGLLLAVLTLPASAPRYSLCWLAILVGVLLAQRAIDSTPARSFAAAVVARPWAFLAAGCVMALAGWVRGEYSIAAALWGALVLIAGRGLPVGRRVLIAVVPLIVAAAPYAWIAIDGGATELGRWAGYAIRDFRHYRGQAIDLSPLGGYDEGMARLVFSFLVGAGLILLWGVHLALRASGRRGPIAPDATLIAPFLAILAAFATYAQSVRFSGENGIAVLPGIAAAWLALRLRVRVPSRAVAIGAAAVLAILFLPLLETFAKLPVQAVRGSKLNEAPEQVPRLDHIPVGSQEWPSMAAIHALWHQRGLGGRPVLATNRRNDLTYANGAYLPWFLDAPPAAWITTYDPGLADRDSVQRDAAADLCRNRAPVVEEDLDPSASSNGEFGFADHRSRYLDEFIALNYRTTAVAGFYRLRERMTKGCIRPDAITLDEASVFGAREHALRDDDIPRAAALSILLVERAADAGAKPKPDDVAGAVLGGYWVPDDQLPSGPTRAALLALRDRAPKPGEAEAVTAARDPIVRLAANTAYLTYRPPGASPQELQSVVKALFYMVRTRAYWPLNVRNLFGLQPPSAQVFGLVQRNAGGGPDLERIRFAFLRHGGSPHDAIESGLRLADLTADHPLDQGQALLDLADVFQADHQTGCAARARAYADSIPGVHYAGEENATAPCPVDIPRPALKPENA